MRVLSMQVKNGAIRNEELESLPDGTEVLVAIEADDDPVELTEDEDRELVESAEEIERGECMPFDDFMRELAASRAER